MFPKMLPVLACWVTYLIIAPWHSLAADRYVAPDGLPAAAGTQEAPQDLATALADGKNVQPGDTIWLRKGTYRGGFKCELHGKPDQPITLRSVPGERVTINCTPRDERDDGMFYLLGSDVTVRDLEVACSELKRVTAEKGPWPADIRGGGIFIRGSRCRVINCVIHDTPNGVGFWEQGEGGEISGCLIYHNGWNGPDRGHGHAVYAQNSQGRKRIADNIIFRQFSHGIHCYGSEKAHVEHIDIVGNFSLFNGVLSTKREATPGIMVGAGSPIADIRIQDNCLAGGRLQVGYPWGLQGESAKVAGNYVAGDFFVCNVKELVVHGNEFLAPETVVRVECPLGMAKSKFDWQGNRYRRFGKQWGPFSWSEQKSSLDGDFAAWKSHFRIDADSSFAQGGQPENHVAVRPNPHQPGRGHVFVANWQQLEQVEINLSGVLKRGQKFRIVPATDYFGKPALAGTYAGTNVRLPMTPRKLPLPHGLSDEDVPEWDARFGAWVVETVE